MHTRPGLVERINSLVGEIAVAHKALSEAHTRLNCIIGVFHTMMIFIFILYLIENLNGLLSSGRFNHHFLETAFKCTVFLYVLAILIESGCADALDFSACKSRFQQVGSVHRARSTSGTHNGVNLIDKENHLFMTRHLINYSLDAFLKLATIFRASHKCSHVERHHTLVE